MKKLFLLLASAAIISGGFQTVQAQISQGGLPLSMKQGAV